MAPKNLASLVRLIIFLKLLFVSCQIDERLDDNVAYDNGVIKAVHNARNLNANVAAIPRAPFPRDVTRKSPFRCPHQSKGLKLWHETSTWGGAIPVAGQNITLPVMTRVLVSQTIAQQLGTITIPTTSELIIGSNSTGIRIDATGFLVNGKLTAGSETCRISTSITITLHGMRPQFASTIAPATTYKGIVVSGNSSKLSLHGRRFYPTWTRLAKSVEVGESQLWLQQQVNWKVGQRIVLVTSAIKDSRDYNQNEVLMIRNINYNPPKDLDIGCIVFLRRPVKYRHIANEYYQVEVGLLSRAILIQGAPNDSEPTDPDPANCQDQDYYSDWSIYYQTTQPCMSKSLTGFGGHIRVESGGIGQVEGVELYRMGQTNVKGRYPMHFHLLGSCPSCYFKASSVHHSFYRCISIHGTNNSLTTENVAFDVIGYCYYLEDGVEEMNTISYNLAAHIHTIGPDVGRGSGQSTDQYFEGPNLILPADVTASGFYITNVHNYIIGNAASGGWAGFAFPILITALQTFKDSGYRPNLRTSLQIDGNTAHSTAWWWDHASSFYFGGDLFYNESGVLQYNPGRSFFGRDPCNVDPCLYYYCPACPQVGKSWIQVTNSKAFLHAGSGLNSWTGRIEVIGFESHDGGLGLEALSEGFWLHNGFIQCRTGENLSFPSNNAYALTGNGFVWYDTYQEHLMTSVTFRNCGVRADEYAQYDSSPSRGCSSSDTQSGCRDDSSTFGFLTHSDQFTPQVMQATRQITFDNCGRRFRFSMEGLDSVSGRGQSWYDGDGTVSGLYEPTIISSGLPNARSWWTVDNDVSYDEQGPLIFTKIHGGPKRNIGYVRVIWDQALYDEVGNTTCGNGPWVGFPCPWWGFVRHAGRKFSPFANPGTVGRGLPLAAVGDVVGPIGGFGWIISFNQTAPRQITFMQPEIDPSTPLLISIPYPIGTTFELQAKGASWCWDDDQYKCNTTFNAVSSLGLVRNGRGNTYFVNAKGVLTFRMSMEPASFTGNPSWILANYTTEPRWDSDLYALDRFERDGLVLPKTQWTVNFLLQARCPSDNDDSPKDGYCSESVASNYDPDVCPSGFIQTAYDKCCQKTNLDRCIFADGSSNF